MTTPNHKRGSEKEARLAVCPEGRPRFGEQLAISAISSVFKNQIPALRCLYFNENDTSLFITALAASVEGDIRLSDSSLFPARRLQRHSKGLGCSRLIRQSCLVMVSSIQGVQCYCPAKEVLSLLISPLRVCVCVCTRACIAGVANSIPVRPRQVIWASEVGERILWCNRKFQNVTVGSHFSVSTEFCVVGM